jgi:hypothetical protein
VNAEEAYDLMQLLNTISLDSEDKQDVLVKATEGGPLAEWRQLCRMIATNINSLLKLSAFIHKHLVPDESSETHSAGTPDGSATLSLVRALNPRLQSRP